MDFLWMGSNFAGTLLADMASKKRPNEDAGNSAGIFNIKDTIADAKKMKGDMEKIVTAMEYHENVTATIIKKLAEKTSEKKKAEECFDHLIIKLYNAKGNELADFQVDLRAKFVIVNGKLVYRNPKMQLPPSQPCMTMPPPPSQPCMTMPPPPSQPCSGRPTYNIFQTETDKVGVIPTYLVPNNNMRTLTTHMMSQKLAAPLTQTASHKRPIDEGREKPTSSKTAIDSLLALAE